MGFSCIFCWMRGKVDIGAIFGERVAFGWSMHLLDCRIDNSGRHYSMEAEDLLTITPKLDAFSAALIVFILFELTVCWL